MCRFDDDGSLGEGACSWSHRLCSHILAVILMSKMQSNINVRQTNGCRKTKRGFVKQMYINSVGFLASKKQTIVNMKCWDVGLFHVCITYSGC